MSDFVRGLQKTYRILAQELPSDWEPSGQFLKDLCKWLEGSYDEKFLSRLTKEEIPAKYRHYSGVVFRGEGLTGEENDALPRRKKFEARGISWTSREVIAKQFAQQRGDHFGLVLRYTPKPGEVALHVQALLSDFNHLFSTKGGCSSFDEQEIILNVTPSVALADIVAVVPADSMAAFEDPYELVPELKAKLVTT